MNKKWPVQDAKSKFSELLDTTLVEGPQIVTKRGVETAVILPHRAVAEAGADDQAGPEGVAPHI